MAWTTIIMKKKVPVHPSLSPCHNSKDGERSKKHCIPNGAIYFLTCSTWPRKYTLFHRKSRRPQTMHVFLINLIFLTLFWIVYCCCFLQSLQFGKLAPRRHVTQRDPVFGRHVSSHYELVDGTYAEQEVDDSFGCFCLIASP